MADALSMALTELLRKAEAEPDLDTLREGVRVLTQALMELEVAQHLGAERVRHVGAQTIPFAERRGSEYFTSGSTAYPRAKARRDSSMPSKREALEDAEGADLPDPRAKVKAVLLELQVPRVQAPTLRLQHLNLGAAGTRPSSVPGRETPFGRRMANEVVKRSGMRHGHNSGEYLKGTERSTYSALGRRLCENVGWPTGREPYGHRALVVVRGRESRPHGEGGQVSSITQNR